MRPNNIPSIQNEKGVALIMAIIIILAMSIMASAISFISNNDYISSVTYEDGQEAFLASESCVMELKKRFEEDDFAIFDPTTVSSAASKFLGSPSGNENTRPYCRTGDRKNDNTTVIEDVAGSHEKNVPGYSDGHFFAKQYRAIVTGKGSRDRDKEDTDPKINTGIEILYGFEVIIPKAGVKLNEY